MDTARRDIHVTRMHTWHFADILQSTPHDVLNVRLQMHNQMFSVERKRQYQNLVEFVVDILLSG